MVFSAETAITAKYRITIRNNTMKPVNMRSFTRDAFVAAATNPNAVTGAIKTPSMTVNPVVIAIKNQSTVITDAQLTPAVAAVQVQVSRDWFPIWRTTATIIQLTKTQPIPAGAWPIYILDNSNVAGALGYHDESTGVPYGRVFVKTCQQYGLSWTVTLSHELLEMLGNPNINLTVFRQPAVGNTGSIYFFEVGDPCQNDTMGYMINGVKVSDFATPAFFDDSMKSVPGTKFDYCGYLTGPFVIGSGGYLSVFNVSKGSGWTTLTTGNVVVPEESYDPAGRVRPER